MTFSNTVLLATKEVHDHCIIIQCSLTRPFDTLIGWEPSSRRVPAVIDGAAKLPVCSDVSISRGSIAETPKNWGTGTQERHDKIVKIIPCPKKV